MAERYTRVAGVIATSMCAVVACFQVALALGAPLGKFAWGGGSTELPAGLRVASAISVAVWSLAAAIVYQRSGLGSARLPNTFVRRGTWALVALFSVGAVMNFASRSAAERWTWGPVALVLAVACFVLARASRASTDDARRSRRE